jgi:alkanesulfonate monooxygenase SsuD/methylene tetrahydromethanopterin reductase-like flavin-dependent oxidoreductase (luciferase family)
MDKPDHPTAAPGGPARTRPLEVGIYLPTWEDRGQGTVPRWSDLLARARRAEALGFDSIWLPDHFFIRFNGKEPFGFWEGWSLLSALAASTTRAELGLLVACAGFRNPALLAKTAATIDEIGGGRLTLGLGAGWHEPEFRAFGFAFDHRVSRFEEALHIVTSLLREGYVDFEGTYYAARDCELRPRGPRPQGPPIMIGTRGAGERMMRLAARYADVWNRDSPASNPGLAPSSPEDLAAWRPRVDAACIAVGRDPATLARTAFVLVDLPGATGREGWGAFAGSSDELAERLIAFVRAGFSAVQVWLEPSTVEGIDAFAPVLERLDRLAPPGA